MLNKALRVGEQNSSCRHQKKIPCHSGIGSTRSGRSTFHQVLVSCLTVGNWLGNYEEDILGISSLETAMFQRWVYCTLGSRKFPGVHSFQQINDLKPRHCSLPPKRKDIPKHGVFLEKGLIRQQTWVLFFGEQYCKLP